MMNVASNPDITTNPALGNTQVPQQSQLQQILQVLTNPNSQQNQAPGQKPSALAQIMSLNNNPNGNNAIGQMSALSNLFGYDKGTLFGYAAKPPDNQDTLNVMPTSNMVKNSDQESNNGENDPNSQGQQMGLWSSLWSMF